MRVLVTGGAGFIGSALIRYIISNTDWRVINLDKLTYAANLDSLAEVATNPRYKFVRLDIGDQEGVSALLAREQPDAIMHLAAETHVDRSIDGPASFVETNIVGTYVLLRCALSYWLQLESRRRDFFRFLHISTDEVFGSLGAEGRFTEESQYRPNSPYAASKASADHLVPTIITNCSNNYGPYQFPEKLIPLIVTRAIAGKSLPVYGDGSNVRDWLYVEDHVRALVHVLENGSVGDIYAIGGNAERKNIELVRMVCRLLDELSPAHDPFEKQIELVKDRPGHDRRYAIDASKLRDKLGWVPEVTFEIGLRKTVRWYLENSQWIDRVLSGTYRGERLGAGQGAFP